MRGPKGILVFVVDENEKRTRGLFGHVCDHDSCVILFLPHTQCYSTIVAQSITCRKIQIYILYLELILNDPLRLFILSKTYQGHLLITEHVHLLFNEQLIFSFRVCAKIEANSLREQGLNMERV